MKFWICCLLFAVLEISTGCAGAKDYLQRGRKALDAGKYDEAAINFRNALKKDPKLAEAYYRLGLAQLRLGNTREAFQALGSAASLMPTDHQVQLAFAELCLQLYQADSKRPKALYDKLT